MEALIKREPSHATPQPPRRQPHSSARHPSLAQQAEYKREGISCDHIPYPDNSAQIELFDSKRGDIFSMLDDEYVPSDRYGLARLGHARATTSPHLPIPDAKFVSKMHDAFANKMLMSGSTRGVLAAEAGAAAVGADRRGVRAAAVRRAALRDGGAVHGAPKLERSGACSTSPLSSASKSPRSSSPSRCPP